MFKNLSIGTKISMGFGIFLITILGINIGSYRDLHNMQGYIHEISARIAPSLNTSQEMIVAMESAYHHVNQYSEDRTDKDTFTKACMDYDAAYHRLKAMLTGRPESLKRLELSNTAFQRFKDISKKNPGQDARSLTAKRQEAFSESRAYMDEIIVSLNALFEDTGRQAQGYVAGAAGFTIYFTIFSFIISILLAWFFTRMITRPLAGVIDGLGNIAHGEGDLTMRLEVQGKDELGILALRFNEFIEYMERLIKEIASISTDLQNATDEVSSGAQGLSGATQEQASAIEEVSATIEANTSSIKVNAENARRGMDLTRDAVQLIEDNTSASIRLSTSMKETKEAASKIQAIIVTVNEVAFQTNLLALNAAVEAARAGEHGKGFAVVAQEVRSLARRSAEASDEIRDLIEDTSDKVNTGNTIAQDSADAISKINEHIKNLSNAMKEITDASSEQADGIDELKDAVSQINSSTQQNASTVEELAGTSENMKSSALWLTKNIKQFHVSAEQAEEQ